MANLRIQVEDDDNYVNAENNTGQYFAAQNYHQAQRPGTPSTLTKHSNEHQLEQQPNQMQAPLSGRNLNFKGSNAFRKVTDESEASSSAAWLNIQNDGPGQGRNDQNESLIDDGNQNQRIMTVVSASDTSNQVY